MMLISYNGNDYHSDHFNNHDLYIIEDIHRPLRNLLMLMYQIYKLTFFSFWSVETKCLMKRRNLRRGKEVTWSVTYLLMMGWWRICCEGLCLNMWPVKNYFYWINQAIFLKLSKLYHFKSCFIPILLWHLRIWHH